VSRCFELYEEGEAPGAIRKAGGRSRAWEPAHSAVTEGYNGSIRPAVRSKPNPTPATKSSRFINCLNAALRGGVRVSNSRGSTVEARGSESGHGRLVYWRVFHQDDGLHPRSITPVVLTARSAPAGAGCKFTKSCAAGEESCAYASRPSARGAGCGAKRVSVPGALLFPIDEQPHALSIAWAVQTHISFGKRVRKLVYSYEVGI
jgi:hypothetical protein